MKSSLAARNIVEEAERIRELAKHAQDPMARTIHLGVIPTLGPYYLPHALTLVHKKHPGLRLLLREEMTPQILEHLNDGKLDAGLLALPVTDDSLRVEPLFYEPFFAALPAGHALAKHDELKVADIMAEKLLLLDEGHCLRDQALDVCGTGSRGREEVRATSLETLRQMVGMGLGLTLLPALAVDAGPRAQQEIDRDPTFQIAAAGPHHRPGVAQARAVSRNLRTAGGDAQGQFANRSGACLTCPTSTTRASSSQPNAR